MPSHDPSPNGGMPEKPNPLGGFLEPVDAAELQIGEVPTVEVAILPKPHPKFGMAFFWFVLFASLFLGFFGAAVAINKGDYSPQQKLIWGLLLMLVFGGIGLAFVIPSAVQKGFTFGKAVLWCFLFVGVTQIAGALVGVCALLGPIVRGELNFADPAWAKSPSGQVFMQAVFISSHAFSILLALTILRWKVGREWKRKIGLGLPSLEHVILVVVGMPALMIVSHAVETMTLRYLPSVKDFGVTNAEEFVQMTKVWPWGVAVLIVAIGPALWEELWCRGFLGQRLASKYGNLGAVLLTSLLFGMIHIDPQQGAFAFLMGIVLYLCYLATRSILVPMLMHLINNLISVLDESTTGQLPIGKSLEYAYDHRPWLALAASLIVLVTVGVVLYYSRVRIWSPEGSEVPAALYPNVEHPLETSANKAEPGPMPAAAVGALIVAACLFGAVWFGL